MKTDNLYIGSEAREKIMSGIRKAANAVSVTMGTSGSNSLIECLERPGQYATNDGATILESIRFADPLEEMGRKILYEAVSRANKVSGDGSSAATVLCAAILEEGMKHLTEFFPMEIKRSLEMCIPKIEESIKSQTKEISVNEVAAVATISAEDEGIGRTIQEIYKKIGKDGIVQWDVSKTAEDSYQIGTGLTVSGATYVSPYMCDMDEKSGYFLNSIKIKNPKVLISKQKISSLEEIQNILESLYFKEVKELVVFCEEIDPIAVGMAFKTRFRENKSFRVAIVKMPVLWKDEWWDDLALASGAHIVSPVGVSLKNATLDDLGEFGNIMITKEDTYVDGIRNLTKHIADLIAEGTEASVLRASRLNTRTARYFVGAHSESALAYRRLKVEDAISAAACALEHGVVVGGGVALLNVSKDLKNYGIGGIILSEALKEPFRKIVQNAGGKVKDSEVGGKIGFNSQTGQVEDLMAKDIVDPADVILNAVKNAIGVAAAILTIGTIVLLPRPEASEVLAEALLSKLPQ